MSRYEWRKLTEPLTALAVLLSAIGLGVYFSGLFSNVFSRQIIGVLIVGLATVLIIIGWSRDPDCNPKRQRRATQPVQPLPRQLDDEAIEAEVAQFADELDRYLS